jgi:hypothetical protein
VVVAESAGSLRGRVPGANKTLNVTRTARAGACRPMFERPSTFSLAERFAYGLFVIEEVCQLAHKSRSAVYEDIRSGKLKVDYDGRRPKVRGPVLAAYLRGEVFEEPAAAPASAKPADVKPIPTKRVRRTSPRKRRE